MSLYRDKLYRVFLGNPPDFLLNISEDITERALALQGIPYKYGDPFDPDIINVNPLKLIQDGFDLDKERIKDQEEIPMEIRQRAVGIWMRSEFYEWMHDRTKDNWQKVFMCNFYCRILMAYVRTYSVEIIDNQMAFVEEMAKTEQYYLGLLREEITPFLTWEQQQLQATNKPFELSSIWTFGIDRLKELSTDLQQAGFILEAIEFERAFNANTDEKCNWLKAGTTLAFLFCFIFSPSKSDLPMAVINLIERRFSIRGALVTRKWIQTTFSNVRKDQLNKREDKLTGEFAIINEICKGTIP